MWLFASYGTGVIVPDFVIYHLVHAGKPQFVVESGFGFGYALVSLVG